MENRSKFYLKSCTQLSLSSQELEELIEKAKDWAVMHGLGLRPIANISKDSIQFAPFTLLPSTLPKSEFENVCELQPIFNMLIHKVAHDFQFLKETLSPTVQVDDFTRRLFDIYETVYNEGPIQRVSLGLLRSDLLLDVSGFDGHQGIKEPFCCLKQVEINTIASGMAWLGCIARKCHQFIFNELGLNDLLKYLPENNALNNICNGILEAWKIYNDPCAIILFIVEDFTVNICDQRYHEFEIKQLNPNVKVIRKTLTQLATEAKLGPNKELIVNDKPVAVVYFRFGYAPENYLGEREWNVRLLIERSLAIKSPSIQYHLAGTKKVQQALAKPNVLKRYLGKEETVVRVTKIFAGLYSLDADESGNVALEMALNNPEKFVLKPQREGGGNNIYGSDIKIFLKSIKSREELKAWILMDKIYPPPQLNYFISASDPTYLKPKELVSELGIYGIIIGDDKNIFYNKQGGHLMRTKRITSNEGGFMTGAAAVDSPFLTE
ncbi:glutathione synthetase-like [Chelonus insularis]|uniref:glutathione synthetase-like n=1 Tax=Chelonus insularis TaxID=460826 RepID=UPI00158909F2|nr:glutathione synthetase-like [Chelonus insularis]